MQKASSQGSFLRFLERKMKEKQKKMQKALDKFKKRAYNVSHQITKGGTAMFTGMFYYFYMFNLGCPSFVRFEK